MQAANDKMHTLSHPKVSALAFNHCHPYCSLSMENVGGIWGIAQSTNHKQLITACLPLLASNIPRIVEMKLSLDQMKEVLQLPSIKRIGGERQLRLVAKWMDGGHSAISNVDHVGQLDNLLPLMNLKSISDTAFCHFTGENNIIMQNHECRYFLFIIHNWNWPEQKLNCILDNRQRLAAALKEAWRATLESDLLLVEVTAWDATEATLRSVAEFHPTGSSRMSIPYRYCCAYSLANGGCIFCQFIGY